MPADVRKVLAKLRAVRPEHVKRVARAGKRRVRLVGKGVVSRAVVTGGGGAAWWIRLGQVRQEFGRWQAAQAAFDHALEKTTDAESDRYDRAHAYYRLARLQAELNHRPAAEQAFAAALAIWPDEATWHGGRGRVREESGDWSGALECYEEAVRLEPDVPTWVTGVVRASTAAGKPAEAVQTCAAALVRWPEDVRLRLALATAYTTLGDWPTAAGVIRGLLATRPTDVTARTQLVGILESWYGTPFSLDHTSLMTVNAPGDRAAVHAEAVALLKQLAKDRPTRPALSYRLGVLYERAGRLEEAADAYRTAMRNLAIVDSWSAFRSAHEYAFRLAYVQERIAPGSQSEPRVGRAAKPAPADNAVTDEPVGVFDAMVTYQGLQITGFLVPGDWRAIDIYLDDQLLKQVRVDESAWRPGLRFDVTEQVLSEFPPSCRLTVRAQGRALVTPHSTEALELTVPDGSGEIMSKLESGLMLTKKGSWPPKAGEVADRQRRYLEVYEHARKALERSGRKLFLCYGTLLGCVREGGFIPYDDDFDVSYVSQADDAGAFREESLKLAFDLLKRGLDVLFSVNGRLFKVGLNNVWIDITPMWFHRERAWAFDAHDFGVKAIEPVATAQFLGHEVYLPNEPEVFLSDAYGSDWRTPQADFRHYRSKDDDQVLAKMWAKPSEVRAFARQAAAELARQPNAGRFVGVGIPAYPGFSWLITSSRPKPPVG